MNPGMRQLYDAIVETVTVLASLNPPADTAEGRLLIDLAHALEEYERTELPPTEPGTL